MAVYFEHRRVWEMAYGPLPWEHIIHHIDGDRSNNALSNLAATRSGEHSAMHVRTNLRATGEYVRCGKYILQETSGPA